MIDTENKPKVTICPPMPAHGYGDEAVKVETKGGRIRKDVKPSLYWDKVPAKSGRNIPDENIQTYDHRGGE